MKTSTFKGMSKLWWVPLITGLLSIAMGIWVLCAPIQSIPVLAYVFAGCLCAAGILNLAYSLCTTGVASNWGWSMALGIMDIIAGVWLFTLPAPVLAGAFIFIVGVWMLCVVINALCETFVISGGSRSWTAWLVFILLVTLIFAIVFLTGPIAGGIAVWLWLGISLITFGIFRFSLAFRIRNFLK